MTQELDFSLINTYYHISPEGVKHPLAEMPAIHFFEPKLLTDMLQKAGDTVQAHGLELPASFFGTSLCHLCSTKLLFLAQHNVILDLSLEHLTFQLDAHGDHAHLGYKINELHYRPIPTEDQEFILLQDWQSFIMNTVKPAVEAIAAAAGMKPTMIWHQFGGGMGMLRHFIHKNETREHVLEQFDRQFLLLSESISAELFNLRSNPFKHMIRYADNPYQSGEKLVMHSSCCLYDRRENGKKCYTCPRMKEEERELKKAAIHASLSGH